MHNDSPLAHVSGNAAGWLFIAMPAIIGWIGLGLAYLLAPHLAAEPQPLVWALYAVGGWYALMIAVFGGWLGLFVLASLG